MDLELEAHVTVDAPFLVTYALLWLLVALLVMSALAIVRELALLRARVGPEPGALATSDGPKIGAVSPVLEGSVLDSGPTRITAGPALLLFVSPTCRPCLELLPFVARLIRSKRTTTYVVLQGTERDARRLLETHEIKGPIFLDPEQAIAAAFDVRMTPFGIAVDDAWTVRTKGVVNDDLQLEALVSYQVTVRPHRAWLPRDDPPDLAASIAGIGGENRGIHRP